MGREVGGGIGMGKTCEPKAFSFQCMTKFTTNKKFLKRKKKKRLRTPNAGDSGLITGQGTRSQMPQLKILRAATKAWHRQIEDKKSCKTEKA